MIFIVLDILLFYFNTQAVFTSAEKTVNEGIAHICICNTEGIYLSRLSVSA